MPVHSHGRRSRPGEHHLPDRARSVSQLMFGRSPKPIKIEIFGKTDLGRTREHNEDRFLVADLTRKAASLQPDVRKHDIGPRGTLLVVADGMGGAAAGELASEMATDTIYDHLVKTPAEEDEITPQRFAYRLKEAVEVANSSIHAHAKAHPEVRGMGTTTTAAGVLNDHLYLTQVGDSRAYLVRGGQAHQITKDQSLMQRLVEAGELTEEEAAQHHPPGARPRSEGEGRSHPSGSAARRRPRALLRRPVGSGQERRNRQSRHRGAGPERRVRQTHRAGERARRSRQHHGRDRALRR